jgi:hypothetical protein
MQESWWKYRDIPWLSSVVKKFVFGDLGSITIAHECRDAKNQNIGRHWIKELVKEKEAKHKLV